MNTNYLWCNSGSVKDLVGHRVAADISQAIQSACDSGHNCQPHGPQERRPACFSSPLGPRDQLSLYPPVVCVPCLHSGWTVALASFMSSRWIALAAAMARVAEVVYLQHAAKAIMVYIGKSTRVTSFAGGCAVQALWSLVPVSTLGSWTDIISSSFLSFREEIVLFSLMKVLCVFGYQLWHVTYHLKTQQPYITIFFFSLMNLQFRQHSEESLFLLYQVSSGMAGRLRAGIT